MAETEFSQDNLAAVRTHLSQLEQMLRFTAASNPHNKTAVAAVFAERPGLAELYLALDGEPKTQAELATALGINQSNVSRAATMLLNVGLIRAIPPSGKPAKVRYAWSWMEPVVRISRLARAHLTATAQASAKDGARKPAKPRGSVPKRTAARGRGLAVVAAPGTQDDEPQQAKQSVASPAGATGNLAGA